MKSSAQIPIWTIAAPPLFAGAVRHLGGTFTQTIAHRPFFLQDEDTLEHADRLGNAVTTVSSVLLLMYLVAVVLLAKKLAPIVEAAILRLRAPNAHLQARAATSSICLSRSAGSS